MRERGCNTCGEPIVHDERGVYCPYCLAEHKFQRAFMARLDEALTAVDEHEVLAAVKELEPRWRWYLECCDKGERFAVDRAYVHVLVGNRRMDLAMMRYRSHSNAPESESRVKEALGSLVELLTKPQVGI